MINFVVKNTGFQNIHFKEHDLGFVCFYANAQIVQLSLKHLGLCKGVLSGDRVKQRNL